MSAILNYLASLGATSDGISRLYEDTYTCLTIFRSLPPLAKHYVLRILYIEQQSIPEKLIDQFFNSRNPDNKRQHIAAKRKLYALQILKKNKRNNTTFVALSPLFQECLKRALLNRVEQQDDSSCKIAKDKKGPGIADLNAFATRRWEQILNFMVGCESGETSDGTTLDIFVIELLTKMKLMQKDDRTNSYTITTEGFIFIFKSTHGQIWQIVLHLIKNSWGGPGFNRDEVLQFLFRLGFLKLGQEYRVEDLTTTQRFVCMHLSHFGLIHQRKLSSPWYYPTQLALNLASERTRSKEEEDKEGFLIVETTYRIYAYTSSDFQIICLNLFARLDYRLPAMVVGTITKSSIRRAFDKNLTSGQIIGYLEQYAHPQMKKGKKLGMNIIPSNVSDQIRSWENERKRFTLSQGMLMSDFKDSEEFRSAFTHAKERDLIIWASAEKQSMVVSKDGEEAMKQWSTARRSRGRQINGRQFTIS